MDPDILLLETGSNDLCVPSVDPGTLSETIIAFMELLQKEIKQSFNYHHMPSDPTHEASLYRIQFAK